MRKQKMEVVTLIFLLILFKYGWCLKLENPILIRKTLLPKTPSIAIPNTSHTHVSLSPNFSDTKRFATKDSEVSDFAGGGFGSFINFLTSNTFGIATGGVCLLLLVINRLTTPDLYDSQSRSDIIAVIASGSLILSAFSLLDVQVREAEKVELEGSRASEYSKAIAAEEDRNEIEWAAETLLKATPCKTLLIYYKDKTIARFGVMGSSRKVKNAPILNKAMSGNSEVYLPALQVLPGKIEFDYLPPNCQSVVLQPLQASDGSNAGVLVLGGDQARAFTERDIAVARRVSQRIERVLNGKF